MDQSIRLYEQFESARHLLAKRHGRDITEFDRKINLMTWSMGRLSLADSRSDPPPHRIRVVSAPTGAGKTMSTCAFAATMLKADPEYSCAFVVETINQAQEVYDELSEMVPKQDLVIWSMAHDVRASEAKNLQDHGFNPLVRHHPDDLRNARCVVVTHAKLVREGARRDDKGVRYFRGERRSQMFIDESPQMVRLIEMTPGDLKKFRDIFIRDDPDHAMAPIIDRVVQRMDDAFTSKGTTYVPVELVDFADHAEIHSRSRSGINLTKAEDLPANLFRDALEFIRVASIGYVFLSRQAPRSFVAYDLQFEVQPGMILLDATADISGLTALMPGAEAMDVPQVDFQNLEIFHVEQPSEFNKKVSEIVDRKVTAQPYAEFIRQTVIDNTSPTDKILVVVHKKLCDHGYVDPSGKPESPVDWAGRQVNVIHWGSGIGSNKYKDADTVFLFSEFYIPRKVVIGNVLGMKDSEATVDTLRSANGQNMRDDFLGFYEGHLLRWTKQLACRGRVREINRDGRCGQMRLFTTMKVDRLMRSQQRLFPCSPPAKLIYPDGSERQRKTCLPKKAPGKTGYSSSDGRSRQKGTRPAERLAELLVYTDRTTLSSDVVETETGVRSCDLQNTLNYPSVQPLMVAHGWSLKSAKEVGLRGKRKVLVKDGSTEGNVSRTN